MQVEHVDEFAMDNAPAGFIGSERALRFGCIGSYFDLWSVRLTFVAVGLLVKGLPDLECCGFHGWDNLLRLQFRWPEPLSSREKFVVVDDKCV